MRGVIPLLLNTPSWNGAQLGKERKTQGQLYLYPGIHGRTWRDSNARSQGCRFKTPNLCNNAYQTTQASKYCSGTENEPQFFSLTILLGTLSRNPKFVSVRLSFLCYKFKERDSLRDLSLDGKMILKRLSNEYGVRLWTGFMCEI
jgi:hypothetical protein